MACIVMHCWSTPHILHRRTYNLKCSRTCEVNIFPYFNAGFTSGNGDFVCFCDTYMYTMTKTVRPVHGQCKCHLRMLEHQQLFILFEAIALADDGLLLDTEHP